MVPFNLILLIYAVSAVSCTSVSKSSKEFVHIGSFKSSGSRVRRAADAEKVFFDENDYYMSEDFATWVQALAECRNQFGPDASTVAIESVEEWNYLREQLEFYGGTTYWTSGLYDIPANTWRWAANDQSLPEFSPWGSGHPRKPNAILRVLLFQINRYTADWRTVSNTQKHRYICEVQKTTLAVPCFKTNDLIVVLDSSGSITLPHYETAKGFVEQLAAAFSIHSPSRLGFIIYSSNVLTIFDLQNNLPSTDISSFILSTQYLSGGTATSLGVNAALMQFESYPRNVPLNMVVLTDGVSNNENATITAAKVATSKGIRLFSVGIGGNINQRELLALAGDRSDRIFYLNNFDELIDILAPLSRKICSSQ